MATNNPRNIKNELVYFLRNSDILTITQRGVTTSEATGTFTAAASYSISVTNVKNIRSIVIGGTTLSYGKDYSVDTYFLDTTYKCKITFTVAQTGVYVITYDHGIGDSIFDDYPRSDLTVSSYPRIGFDIISSITNEIALGGTDTRTKCVISFVVCAVNKKNVAAYIYAIRAAFLSAKKDFYTIKFITPIGSGPMGLNPNPSQKIMQQNIDFEAILPIETVAF